MNFFLKRIIFAVLISLLLFSCFNYKGNKKLYVGMVTDFNGIDDKSFNKGLWLGIKDAEKKFNIKAKAVKTTTSTDADYLSKIDKLYNDGYRLIICPGYSFETVVFKAQKKYSDARFVIVDGNAHSTDSFESKNGANTVSITFCGHEAGFLAGLAAALQVKEGNFGFIGGLEIPPVQKFSWGWQQGILYANENFGTKIKMVPENFIYREDFSDIADGQKLAAHIYDSGVNVIHAAAGVISIGAIQEAKERYKNGEKVWVVGVDVDQYEEGLVDNNHSVVLTSAVKNLSEASYNMIESYFDGSFKGGSSIVLSVKEDSVGIPKTNPNLSDEVYQKVMTVYKKIKSGEINVKDEQGELFR